MLKSRLFLPPYKVSYLWTSLLLLLVELFFFLSVQLSLENSLWLPTYSSCISTLTNLIISGEILNREWVMPLLRSQQHCNLDLNNITIRIKLALLFSAATIILSKSEFVFPHTNASRQSSVKILRKSQLSVYLNQNDSTRHQKVTSELHFETVESSTVNEW